jgi:hypothetical protein
VAVCQYHRDRPGVGVCMRCRAVICAACCTRLDGINHCHACLRSLGRGTKPDAPGRGVAALTTACTLALAWLLFFGLFWLTQGWLAP